VNVLKLRTFRVGTRMPTVSRTERQCLVPLKHLLLLLLLLLSERFIIITLYNLVLKLLFKYLKAFVLNL
jgi:hypothetical protein